MQSLQSLFSFHFSPNPLKLYASIKKYLLLRHYNHGWKIHQFVGEGEIIDSALNFQLTTAYITPEKQINQLIDAGFKGVRIFSLFDGAEITDHQRLKELTDPWLYYVAKV